MINKKKKILITGSSSGIGYDAAKFFIKKNYTVVGISRTKPKIGRKYKHIDFDLTNYSEYNDLFNTLHKEYGKFDYFLYSAGRQFIKPIKIIESYDIDEMFNINLKSAILMSRILSHKKYFNSFGSAVFIASVMGVKGSKGQTVYSASKGGLISFVKSLALELSSSNIRVNCISPGVIKSAMFNKYKKNINSETYQKVLLSHPSGFGEFKDITNLINFLFSQESKWITGQNIIIDGGFSI